VTHSVGSKIQAQGAGLSDYCRSPLLCWAARSLAFVAEFLYGIGRTHCLLDVDIRFFYILGLLPWFEVSLHYLYSPSKRRTQIQNFDKSREKQVCHRVCLLWFCDRRPRNACRMPSGQRATCSQGHLCSVWP